MDLQKQNLYFCTFKNNSTTNFGETLKMCCYLKTFNLKFDVALWSFTRRVSWLFSNKNLFIRYCSQISWVCRSIVSLSSSGSKKIYLTQQSVKLHVHLYRQRVRCNVDWEDLTVTDNVMFRFVLILLKWKPFQVEYWLRLHHVRCKWWCIKRSHAL